MEIVSKLYNLRILQFLKRRYTTTKSSPSSSAAEDEIKSIPADIVAEILVRLPVKAIGRCMCVCKTWRSITQEPFFINKQLRVNHGSATDEINSYLIHHDFVYIFDVYAYRTTRFKFEFYSSRTTTREEFSESSCLKEHKKLNFLASESGSPFVLEGSCNGVLCLSGRREIVLWNPSINKFKIIPKPQSQIKTIEETDYLGYQFLGVEFVPETCDYKVISFENKPNHCGWPEVEIYSLNKTTDDDTWKTKIWSGDAYKVTKKYCYKIYSKRYPLHTVKGNRTWLATKQRMSKGMEEIHNIILMFDMVKEEFREISLPVEKGVCDEVTDFQNSVAFFSGLDGRCWDLWVMKDYGLVTSSWIKMYSSIDILGTPYDVMSDGNVVFYSYDKLFVVYDPRTGLERVSRVNPAINRVVVYKESLALLNVDEHISDRDQTRRRQLSMPLPRRDALPLFGWPLCTV